MAYGAGGGVQRTTNEIILERLLFFLKLFGVSGLIFNIAWMGWGVSKRQLMYRNIFLFITSFLACATNNNGLVVSQTMGVTAYTAYIYLYSFIFHRTAKGLKN